MSRRGVPAFLSVAFQRVMSVAFLVSIALLVLYGVGNTQGFLDATQYLLLDVAGITLWVSFLTGVLVAVLLIVNSFVEKRFPVLRFLGVLVMTLASGALVALLEFLAAWLAG